MGGHLCLGSGSFTYLSSSSTAEEEEFWLGPRQPGPTTTWDAAAPTQVPAGGCVSTSHEDFMPLFAWYYSKVTS